ncbi:hypothetical protein LOK49_LG09G01681 [Camellia lanceoleosa]|uniref:Uncharacterized protein n=1 Tax=Camellia lanceoleosa TaxID=1840588 RepID=A0ACC0GHC8_9ERIC|nr:hypothetical protein LOK49_LG09G01681 [Camellia lanceoleosa]
MEATLLTFPSSLKPPLSSSQTLTPKTHFINPLSISTTKLKLHHHKPPPTTTIRAAISRTKKGRNRQAKQRLTDRHLAGIKYKGFTVKQFQDLRRTLPQTSKLIVAKNTLVLKHRNSSFQDVVHRPTCWIDDRRRGTPICRIEDHRPKHTCWVHVIDHCWVHEAEAHLLGSILVPQFWFHVPPIHITDDLDDVVDDEGRHGNKRWAMISGIYNVVSFSVHGWFHISGVIFHDDTGFVTATNGGSVFEERDIGALRSVFVSFRTLSAFRNR